MGKGRQKGDTCAPLAVRLWRRVQKTETCWLWMGVKNKMGYGRINDKGKNREVKRVAYELVKGPIPTGLEIDHLCRNPQCVNPDHLEAVTHQVNVLRGMAPNAILFREGRCKEGHPATPENTHRYKTGKRQGRVAFCLVCRREKRKKGLWK